MASYTALKDPDEVLDFGFNLADWLATGDSLASANFDVEAGLTEESEVTSGNAAAVMVSGGTANNAYSIKGTLTTSQGRVLVRRISLYCLER